jgi:hypothetical protein
MNRLIAVFCILVLSSFPVAAKRLALVIGNDNYVTVTKLKKAGNDATSMAAELRNAGFEVTLHKDLTYRGMVKAVDAFTSSITGGDEVVVFFAGHGLQLKSGNYLLPIDIEPNSSSEVEKTAYALDELKDKLSEARPAFSLVIADACRAPLENKSRAISTGRGLSPVEPAKGQMVVYSASRGQEALDRLSNTDTNPNSVFTREFLVRMKQPGVRIEDIVREVQDAVEQLAKTVKHDQRPALYNESRGNFYFYGAQAGQQNAVTPPASNNPDQREDNYWNDVKAAGNTEAFDAYLKKYPNGNYVALANANINRLKKSEGASTPAPPSVSANLPQSVPLGVIYSDDCDLKLMHAYKFAVSWERVGNELYEKHYNFFNEAISIDKVQGKIDGRGRGVFNRLDRNASSSYEFSNDSVRLLSRIVDGKESVIEGVQVWDKNSTRKAYKCAANSFMAKKVVQLNLKSCPGSDKYDYKYAQCFGTVDYAKDKQLYVGNLLAGRENGWGIRYLEKSGERLVGIWTSSAEGGFFQGFQFDQTGKLYNVVKSPIENLVGVKKAELSLADIPKELGFNFSLPKCKKINFVKDVQPTSVDKNKCLAIEKHPEGFVIAEFNNGLLDGKMITVGGPAEPTVVSMTFSGGNPKGFLRGDYLDPENFQGELANGDKAKRGEFRYQTSKRSIALGKWSNDGKYVDICVYGGDDGLEDIGGGFTSGKCYSKLDKPL